MRAPRPVEVGQHRVEQPGALHHTGFQCGPVVRGDQQRQPVQVPGGRHGGQLAGAARATLTCGDAAGALPGLHGDVGDAVPVDQIGYRRAQPVQAGVSALAEDFGQLPPARPDVAGGIDELVVSGEPGPAAAHVEQRLLRPRGAVGGQQPVGSTEQRVRRSGARNGATS